jgi:hypothetical protein
MVKLLVPDRGRRKLGQFDRLGRNLLLLAAVKAAHEHGVAALAGIIIVAEPAKAKKNEAEGKEYLRMAPPSGSDLDFLESLVMARLVRTVQAEDLFVISVNAGRELKLRADDVAVVNVNAAALLATKILVARNHVGNIDKPPDVSVNVVLVLSDEKNVVVQMAVLSHVADEILVVPAREIPSGKIVLNLVYDDEAAEGVIVPAMPLLRDELPKAGNAIIGNLHEELAGNVLRNLAEIIRDEILLLLKAVYVVIHDAGRRALQSRKDIPADRVEAFAVTRQADEKPYCHTKTFLQIRGRQPSPRRQRLARGTAAGLQPLVAILMSIFTVPTLAAVLMKSLTTSPKPRSCSAHRDWKGRTFKDAMKPEVKSSKPALPTMRRMA